ncbi:MAG: prolyl oligopeptidase family serine peptidase [Chthonomonadales bacterium]
MVAEVLICAVAVAVIAQNVNLPIPPTRRVEQVDDYYGVKISDPYRWLEDTQSPETREWIEAQNRVTLPYLRSLPQREPFRRRLEELFDYPRYRAPFREAGRYFFFKNDGLQNQPVLYWQQGLAGEPRVLLDPNTLSASGTVAVTAADVSPDGTRLAYSLSQKGSDWQTFHVRDVDTGADLSDRLEWTKFTGASWTHDGAGFFYSRYPAPEGGNPLLAVNTQQRLYYHRLGEPQERDAVIYERPDHPDWGISGTVSEDGRYLILYLTVGTDPRTRVYVKDLGDPRRPDLAAPVVKLLDGFDAAYWVVGNDGATFYVVTDREAPRRKLVAIDLNQPAPEHWRTLLPEGKDTLQEVHLVGSFAVVRTLHNACSRLQIFDLEGRLVRSVRLPGIGTITEITGKRSDGEFFYTFTSFLMPPTVYRYDTATMRSRVYRKPEMRFDASPFETRQVWYRSKDGTRIPMFVTHRKGLRLDGSHPCYLTGYGGFNIPITPGLSIPALIWMEQGGVYAVPNLRGGGEFGEEWHRAGTREHKQNVFDDFIAAAEYLIRKGYTRPERLVIAGGSNGGLLVGAALTQRPDLFAAALPAVGVLDMLRYHRFTIGWMWASDYGTSEDPHMFRVLLAYSPLHNIRSGTRYPATLITTGDHDDRVAPGHSFKFAAALQAAQAGTAPILIRIETEAGHGGGKPMAKWMEEAADTWAFAMAHAGMAWHPPLASREHRP